MPLKKCSSGGKSGWKWGDQGKCYIGKNGKKLAIKQGIAIEGPDKFKSKAKLAIAATLLSQDELDEILEELDFNWEGDNVEKNKYLQSVENYVQSYHVGGSG